MSSDDEGGAPKAAAAPAAKPAMSRFLKSAGDSSSSSDDSSDEESEMSEDEDKEKPRVGRFLHGASSDDSDDDTKRVVKSARDKRLDEMEATGKLMDNALKINDWVAISTGAPFLVLVIIESAAAPLGVVLTRRRAQNSTSWCGWCRGSRTCRSLLRRSSSVRWETWRPP